VVDFNTVEGIQVDIDKKDKVIEMLGDPEYVSEYEVDENLTWEYLKYTSKGLLFTIKKSNQLVEVISIYGSNYYVLDGANRQYYTTYPYDLPYGWKLKQTTMNSVVDKEGNPNLIRSSERLRSYQYESLDAWYRFYSDSEGDYSGKEIVSVTIY